MKYSLLFLITILFISNSNFAMANSVEVNSVEQRLARLEKEFDGKIGIYAINTGNNQVIAYRANDRFPVQSTFKLIGVSALLKESDKKSDLLNEVIHYTKNDLLVWHPITGRHVKDGMTLEALSEAAMSYSDNTAINLIMKKLGGPENVTNFARSIGNNSFNITHYERDLNSDLSNKQDTSTPMDMATSVNKLLYSNILSTNSKSKLITWMKNNTTAYKRIRSGAPIGWVVAEKSGSGDYGVANDIGVVWSATCKPIIIAIFTVADKKEAKYRDDIVASSTSIVLDEFSQNDGCFKALTV